MTTRDADLSRVVADRVAAARRARGWSMERLADEAGLHRTTIGLIERGRRAMTLDVADRLTRCLDLSLWEVIRDAPGASEAVKKD